MMGTEIFKINASWAEKLTKTRVPFLMTPTVGQNEYSFTFRGGHQFLSLPFSPLRWPPSARSPCPSSSPRCHLWRARAPVRVVFKKQKHLNLGAASSCSGCSGHCTHEISFWSQCPSVPAISKPSTSRCSGLSAVSRAVESRASNEPS